MSWQIRKTRVKSFSCFNLYRLLKFKQQMEEFRKSHIDNRSVRLPCVLKHDFEKTEHVYIGPLV